MMITKNSVVSLSYKMFDDASNLLDETEEPMQYLHGGYDGIFPLVEEALEGKSVGESVDITLEADDAFGEYDEDLVRQEQRSDLPEEIEEGMVLEADDPDTGETLLFTVTELEGDVVHLDANHPLAGRSIRFVCEITEVRAATEEEVQHGHAHDAGGHHH
jgi:FKBP-type peptidyl-prolyl cis-trans isomerase SlyD